MEQNEWKLASGMLIISKSEVEHHNICNESEC